MPKPPRSRNAVRRASFGRAERLKREAGDGRAPEQPRRQKARQDRARPAPQQERSRAGRAARPTPAFNRAAAQERKLVALDTVRQRIDQADAKTAKLRLRRLEEQTRATFNEKAERRRNHGRRAEQERVRQQGEAVRKKADDRRRVQAKKTLDQKGEQMRRAFNKEGERRRDLTRRLQHERQRQRAAAEIEREQQRQRADQQAAHRREREGKQTARRINADGYCVTENHAARILDADIQYVNQREDAELDKLAASRSGLRSLAELLPGRRAANDRKVEEIKERHEAERQAKHRDHNAAQERRFDNEQKARLAYFRELKVMQEAHRSGRASLGREQAEARPGLVEGRARAIERTEREYQHERERVEPARENVRPAGDFGRAASGHAREPAAGRREFSRSEGRQML